MKENFEQYARTLQTLAADMADGMSEADKWLKMATARYLVERMQSILDIAMESKRSAPVKKGKAG